MASTTDGARRPCDGSGRSKLACSQQHTTEFCRTQSFQAASCPICPKHPTRRVRKYCEARLAWSCWKQKGVEKQRGSWGGMPAAD